jgi:hypothetical protein
MKTVHHLRMVLCKSTLAFALVLIPAFSQTKATDGQQIVRLTLPKLQAALTAFSNFGQLLASDPALAKQYKEINKSLSDKDGDETLGGSLARLQAKDPRVGSAFTKAGISIQEAAPTLQMLMAAAMADAMMQPGQPIPKDMEPALAENLKFYRQHRQELAPSIQKFQALCAQFAESSK